jgi:hypothetical protein
MYLHTVNAMAYVMIQEYISHKHMKKELRLFVGKWGEKIKSENSLIEEKVNAFNAATAATTTAAATATVAFVTMSNAATAATALAAEAATAATIVTLRSRTPFSSKDEFDNLLKLVSRRLQDSTASQPQSILDPLYIAYRKLKLYAEMHNYPDAISHIENLTLNIQTGTLPLQIQFKKHIEHDGEVCEVSYLTGILREIAATQKTGNKYRDVARLAIRERIVQKIGDRCREPSQIKELLTAMATLGIRGLKDLGWTDTESRRAQLALSDVSMFGNRDNINTLSIAMLGKPLASLGHTKASHHYNPVPFTASQFVQNAPQPPSNSASNTPKRVPQPKSSTKPQSRFLTTPQLKRKLAELKISDVDLSREQMIEILEKSMALTP